MSETRKFHIGTILSITTGVLLAPNHIDDVYDILNFMSGEKLQTVQLPRVADECRPYLMEYSLHGHIGKTFADIDASHVTPENYEQFMREIVTEYGEWYEVRPIHPEDHEIVSPVDDALRINPDLEIIEFKPEDKPSPYGNIDWKN